MKYLFFNTAGAFSLDYQTHVYQCHKDVWSRCKELPQAIVSRVRSSSAGSFSRVLDLKARSPLFSLYLSKVIGSSTPTCIITLAGIVSKQRQDFTGRKIYDAIALNTGSDVDARFDQSDLDEAEQIAKGLIAFKSEFCDLFDRLADMQSFEKDLYPFSDAFQIYNRLLDLPFDDEAIIDHEPSFDFRVSVARILGILGFEFNSFYSSQRAEEVRREIRSKPTIDPIKSTNFVARISDEMHQQSQEIQSRFRSLLPSKLIALFPLSSDSSRLERKKSADVSVFESEATHALDSVTDFQIRTPVCSDQLQSLVGCLFQLARQYEDFEIALTLDSNSIDGRGVAALNFDASEISISVRNGALPV